jgi:Zinc finger, C3HC4 type (RING finger)
MTDNKQNIRMNTDTINNRKNMTLVTKSPQNILLQHHHHHNNVPRTTTPVSAGSTTTIRSVGNTIGSSTSTKSIVDNTITSKPIRTSSFNSFINSVTGTSTSSPFSTSTTTIISTPQKQQSSQLQSSSSTTLLITPRQQQQQKQSITPTNTNGSSNSGGGGRGSGLIRTLSFKGSSPLRLKNAFTTTGTSSKSSRQLVSRSGSGSSTVSTNVPQSQSQKGSIDWHKDIINAFDFNNWDTIRTNLEYYSSQIQRGSNSFNITNTIIVNGSDHHQPNRNSNGVKRTSSFWSRLAGGGGGSSKSNSNTNADGRDKTGLLVVDNEQRTPLLLLLSCQQMNVTVPDDIVIQMIQLEPRACSITNSKGRLPLHFSIIHQHSIEIIKKLVEIYPTAISIQDNKKLTPLEYSIDIVKRTTELYKAPTTFWMPLPYNCIQAIWQQEQIQKWNIVHYLLLSNVTTMYYPQTTNNNSNNKNNHYSTTNKKPMLVDALINAASPNVISLLISASILLLSFDTSTNNSRTNKASAFAGSTVYTCITRHYPYNILVTLISYCPRDVYKIQDETGMGLIAAQYISGCYYQLKSTQAQEWKLSTDFYNSFIDCLLSSSTTSSTNSSIMNDPALYDWWLKIEFLISFCCPTSSAASSSTSSSSTVTANATTTTTSRTTSISTIPKHYLLHAALINSDVPPLVIKMLLKLYPQSINLTWYPPTTTSNDNKSKQQKVKESQQQQQQQSVTYASQHHDQKLQQQQHQQQKQQQLLSTIKPFPTTVRSVNSTDTPTSIATTPSSIYDNNTTPICYSNDDDNDNDNSYALQHTGGALPLHLVSMTKEYMKRFYERTIVMDNTTDNNDYLDTTNMTTFDITLKANPSAIWKRYDNRLPIHYAIGSGRLLTTLNRLIDIDPNQLLVRDPKTLLYPFLQVAAYNDQNDKDSYRWSCRARNQYSNADWKNLSDRNKAIAVLKIAEHDTITRIETCYTLLRRNPNVLQLCFQSNTSHNADNNNNNSTNVNSKILNRDSTGIGTVALHYISWCYDKVKKYDNTVEWKPNRTNQQFLQQQLRNAQTDNAIITTSDSVFNSYWAQQLFWIKRCCPSQIKITLGNGNDETHVITFPRTISYNNENEYRVVHAAIANSDTPPQVIQLLTNMYPFATSCSVTDTQTSLLPLHLAAHVQTYTCRIFESSRCNNTDNDNILEQHVCSTLDIVLRSYPTAARVVWNGLLPLHIAINSGKSETDIRLLIKTEPRSLTVRDPIHNLYPFQLMAIPRIYTPEQRCQFQYVTRNKYDEDIWNKMSPQQQTKQFRNTQQEHQLTILSCIYTLIRSNPTILNKHIPVSHTRISSSAEISSTDSCASEELHRDIKDTDPTIEMHGDMTISEVDDTEVSNNNETMTPYLSKSKKELDFQLDGASSHSSLTPSFAFSPGESIVKKPSPLVLLLSQHSSRSSKHAIDDADDLFECDASVFSSVDVMSALSSTHHPEKESKKQYKRRNNNGSQMMHFDMLAMDEDTTTSSCDEMETNHALTTDLLVKEVSQVKKLVDVEAQTNADDDASIEDDIFEASDDDSSCSDDSTVVFEIRKKPRFYTKKDKNVAPSGIKLTKKQGQGTSIHSEQNFQSVQDSIDKQSYHDDGNNHNNNNNGTPSVGSRPSCSATSSTSSHAPGHYIEANVEANAVVDDESSITWESYKPLQNVSTSTSRTKKQVNTSPEPKSPTSASATGSSKASTLLGTMNDVSHNSYDDDPLLTFKKELSTVSSLSTDLNSSSKKSSGTSSSKSSRSKNRKLEKKSMLGSFNNSGTISLDEHFENMNNQSLASVSRRRTRDAPPMTDNENGPIDFMQGKALVQRNNVYSQEIVAIGVQNTVCLPLELPIDPNEPSTLNTPLEVSNKFLPVAKTSSHRGISIPADETPSVDSLDDTKACNMSLDWSKTSNTLEGLIALNSIVSESTAGSKSQVDADGMESALNMDSSKRSILNSNSQPCRIVLDENVIAIQKEEIVDTTYSDNSKISQSKTIERNCHKVPKDCKQFQFNNDVVSMNGQTHSQIKATKDEISTVKTDGMICFMDTGIASDQKFEVRFDKIAFRWNKVPVNDEHFKQCLDTNRDIAYHALTTPDVVLDEQIQPAQDTKRVIFDKKTMSWRVQESLINDVKHEFIKPESKSQRSKDKVSLLGIEHKSEHSVPCKGQQSVLTALPPVPFLGEKNSRHKSKRRNKAFSSYILHKQDSKKAKQVVTSSASRAAVESVDTALGQCIIKQQDKAIKSSQQQKQHQQKKNSNSKNNQWSTMFNSHARLLCLQCDENNIEVLLLPCRHLCLCRNCCTNYQPNYQQVQEPTELKYCPLCGAEVTDKMLIY